MNNFVLITGVSTGIGYETAKLLIRKGFPVLGSVRRVSDANRLADEFGSSFHPLIFDVTDMDAIQQAVHKAREIIRDGRLVALVNNAGIAVNGPLLHIDPQAVEYQLNVNVLGPLRVLQAFFPLFKPGQEPGVKKRIIQMSSISGLLAFPLLGPYAMSKFALEAMTDALRRECELYPDIDVVILEPASFETPIWDKALKEEQKYMDTDFAALVRKKDKFVASQKESALPTPMLANLIHKLITGRKVPRRMLIAKPKWVLQLLVNWMPTRIVDKILTRPFRRLNDTES